MKNKRKLTQSEIELRQVLKEAKNGNWRVIVEWQKQSELKQYLMER